jgi:hypothetical protein
MSASQEGLNFMEINGVGLLHRHNRGKVNDVAIYNMI